ncbi:AAA family ATPase [Saccharopolyspora hirsuta]|uniref:AAA family ATPase n=1 Tax=Saccharopolyspora hirsuta TaxID=1837 RepID=A0A5M7BXY3_SACHI|nr:AAA family ATPase [Saccharopolyspora hirsuta]KAA5835106.1 AAA family ATPase [Saccharopolyspora hirsuta]
MSLNGVEAKEVAQPKSPLAERDAQLDILRRAQEDCLRSRGSVVLVEGPLGSGKTELLRIAAQQAEAVGFRVLRAVCDEDERDLPCGAVAQLVRGIGERSADRAGARLVDGMADAEPRLARVFQQLCATVLNESAHTPLLMSVDDVQHLDEESASWLLQLIRRSASSRVMVVLTGELGRAPQRLRAELRRHAHFRRTSLAPLSPGGVTTVLQRRVDDVTAQRLSTVFHSLTGGNPLLLNAVIDDHEQATAPRNHDLALLSCLHRGGELMRDVARALAVLDSDADPADLARLVRASTADVRDVLEAMSASGLLDEGRLRSTQAVAAVLDEVGPDDLRGLHWRTAELLHDRGAEAALIAAQLVESGSADAPWAQRALREAAELALLEGSAECAARYLELAHDSTDSPQERAAIRARLAEAEWRLKPSSVLRHLAPLTAAASAGRLDRVDHVVLVRQLLWHGKNDEAQQVLRRLRNAEDEHACGQLHDVESWLAYSHPALAHQRQERTPCAQPEVPHSAGDDPWLHSTAVLADVLARGRSHEAVEHAERVLRDVHPTRTAVWSEEATTFALMALLHAERADTAAEWCRRLESGEQRGRPPWKALISGVRAEIAARRGESATAVEHAEAALQHMPPQAWGVAIGLPLSTLVLANTRLGRFDEAARHLARPVSDAVFRSRYGLHYLQARGQYYLATRHGHAALADFLACRDLTRDWGLAQSGLVPWRINAAEAWLLLGNTDEAKRLLYDELAQAGTEQRRSRGTALRLVAATNPPRRRPQLLGEALDLLEQVGDRYEQARVLADLGRAHHELKDNRRARRMFSRAWHLANACGAAALCDELLSAGGQVASATAVSDADDRAALLTESERRVASLAVMGYTNREIAEKLFVTASTVEQHLTRVFRKLGVKRRENLPVDLWGTAVRTA